MKYIGIKQFNDEYDVGDIINENCKNISYHWHSSVEK